MGRGFFVGFSGFFITAAHVATAFPVNTHRLCIPQFVNDQPRRHLLRWARHVVVHLKTDIAMGILDPEWHPVTGEPVFNERVALTSQLPGSGESIHGYSFPQTIVTRDQDSALVLPLPRWAKGTVLHVYRNGRDSVMQPGVCVEASLQIPGGGSGGPVFNSKGQAFGVVSTGISGSSVTYIAPFAELLDFPFAIATPTDGEAAFEVTLRSVSCVDEVPG